MRYVALLRAVNVGGRGTVSMGALKRCFEDLGFERVATYINSGNIVFSDSRKDVRKLLQLIESAIAREFGMDVRVIVKSKDEIAAICRKLPQDWVTDDVMRTDVMFLREEIDTPEVRKAIASNPAVDRLLHVKGALIWNVTRTDYPRSKLAKIMGTVLYRNMTARNANTTRKLLELMSDD